MICEYCGKEFVKRGSKYCSRECCYEADKQRKRLNYVWKSERHGTCIQCGKPLVGSRRKFCSQECASRYEHIKEGKTQNHGELVKTCVVCGKEFTTWQSNKITCSDECKTYNNNHRKNSKERNRKAYLKKNPNARKLEDIMIEAKAKKQRMEEERARLQAEKAKVLAENRAKKEAEKQARKEYWQNYHEARICANCGKTFVSNFPTKKYCSDKCANHYRKVKRRYKTITVDKNISIEGVALRDKNVCQLCGQLVDWDDYEVIDSVVICGNNYPSIDHIIPISLGGVHAWDNVQLAHRVCNSCKSNRYIG